MVVDAGVLAVALADDEEDGRRARAALRGRLLVAPALVDLEVTAVWHRAVATGALRERRAALALADLDALPLRRMPHALLTRRCWTLQDTLPPADAAYVALAEALDVALLTTDRRLATDRALRCAVELLD